MSCGVAGNPGLRGGQRWVNVDRVTTDVPGGISRRSRLRRLAPPALLSLALITLACTTATPTPAAAPPEAGEQEAEAAAEDGEQQAQSAQEQQAEPEPPAPVAPEIALPPGFAAVRWAEELRGPTALAFSPDGRLFVAERAGRVWTLRDGDGNGAAEERVLFLEDAGLSELLGIAVLDDRRVYLSDRGRVSLAEDDDGDGVADSLRVIARDLPADEHQNNGLAIGPDGLVYITVGATCNDCEELSPLSASVLQLDAETGLLRVFASGLRNPADLAFTPDGELWVVDNGSQAPCPRPDELNRLEDGASYGWPYCTPAAIEGVAPVLELGLRSFASGLIWFESVLYPATLSGGFYIVFLGVPGDQEIGRRVQFAQERADGDFGLRDFATGFDRPFAIRAGADAALYVSDFGRGVIYRIGSPPE